MPLQRHSPAARGGPAALVLGGGVTGEVGAGRNAFLSPSAAAPCVSAAGAAARRRARQRDAESQEAAANPRARCRRGRGRGAVGGRTVRGYSAGGRERHRRIPRRHSVVLDGGRRRREAQRDGVDVDNRVVGGAARDGHHLDISKQTKEQRQKARCATAATHSDVCWRRDLLKMGGAGVEKREPEEEWKSEEWKATAVYHWGSKNSYEEEELPECSLDRPRVDAKEGSRFLGWQNEDLRSVICELDRKNKLLQKKVEEQDAEKQAERDKHKMEKKMIARISKEKLMCRDRMLVFATAMCLGLCAILFALAVK